MARKARGPLMDHNGFAAVVVTGIYRTKNSTVLVKLADARLMVKQGIEWGDVLSLYVYIRRPDGDSGLSLASLSGQSSEKLAIQPLTACRRSPSVPANWSWSALEPP